MQKADQLNHYRKTSVYTAIISAVAAVATLAAVSTRPVFAQAALEEIVVTAQRRNQSMQDVPISLEAISGDTIQKQGYRALDEMALFTPTVIVEPEHLRPSMSVRGLGAATTDGFSVEQSTPIFLDGVHYARTSMIKLSFLDVQQVEILKGPQPVYFGQNAIAGAFNITTRKPTPEWEGYVDGGYSSFNTYIVEAAAGGPISDTFGIRVAGKYDKSDGYLRDVVSDEPFPDYKNLAGRVLLQWRPNEVFNATAKFDTANLDKGAEGTGLCIKEGVTTPQLQAGGFTTTSVWLNPPQGTADRHRVPFEPLPSCDDFGNQGRSSGGPRFAPDGSYLENGNRNAIDIRDAATALYQDMFGVEDGLKSFEYLTPWSTYLDLSYELDSGIILSSLSSYDEYERVTNRENRGGLMLANSQYRDHDFRSASQELRASSPVGGDWNWMVGAYVQDIDEESVLLGLRGNTDQPIRVKFYEGVGNWKSAFANVSYDALMEGKMSISVGARYSHVKKATKIYGYYDTWIMRHPTTGVATTLPYGCRAATGCPGFNLLTGLWQGATAVGYTTTHTPINDPSLPVTSQAPMWDNIDEPQGTARATELDPQIVLSYRPTDEHTMYVKYVESFKAGGADGSLATFPTVRRTGDVNPVAGGASTAFEFNPEYAFHWELGAKGNLIDGRMRYDISVFDTKIKDLQIGTTQALSNNSFISFGNAGEQRVKGVEFAVDYAATDRLTMNFGGVVMDNTMVDFLSTCTEVEFEFPDISGCDVVNSTIDRSGTRGANAPVWKFVMNGDYEMPVMNTYILGFNAQGYIADGYITDNTGFSQENMMDQHEDISMQVALSDSDAVWKVTAFARNLLHPRTTYFPENDIGPVPLTSMNLDTKHFTTYGVKFRYNFFGG